MVADVDKEVFVQAQLDAQAEHQLRLRLDSLSGERRGENAALPADVVAKVTKLMDRVRICEEKAQHYSELQ
jgi:hypothetical protein